MKVLSTVEMEAVSGGFSFKKFLKKAAKVAVAVVAGAAGFVAGVAVGGSASGGGSSTSDPLDPNGFGGRE